jgi:hypothetical protein
MSSFSTGNDGFVHNFLVKVGFAVQGAGFRRAFALRARLQLDQV